jgi:hypothetical protein
MALALPDALTGGQEKWNANHSPPIGYGVNEIGGFSKMRS